MYSKYILFFLHQISIAQQNGDLEWYESFHFSMLALVIMVIITHCNSYMSNQSFALAIMFLFANHVV